MVNKALFFSLPLLVSVSTHNVYAKKNNRPTPSKTRPCKTLKLCADLVSSKTGHKYIFSKELKGKVFLSKNYKVTKENAEKIFSEALNLHGLTRVKIEDGVFRIINSRDVRYSPVEMINITNYNLQLIPNLSDYFMINMSLKKHEYPSEITRALRPFLSRYGRIIHTSGKDLILQDTGRNLRRLVKLVQTLDKKLSSDEIEKIEQAKRRRHERELKSFKEVTVPKK